MPNKRTNARVISSILTTPRVHGGACVCVCVCVCVHVFVTCGNECVCGWSSECFPVHVCVPVRPRIRVDQGHLHNPSGFVEALLCPILKSFRDWNGVEVAETSYGDPPTFAFVCAWACACVRGWKSAQARACNAARGACVAWRVCYVHTLRCVSLNALSLWIHT